MGSLRDMLRKARTAVLRRGVSGQDADDVVQQAFLRVEEYERRQVVRSKEAVLVTAAVNLAIDFKRQKSFSVSIDVNDAFNGIADQSPAAEDILQAQARLRRAAEGLELLPERTRRILLSRRLDGLSYKEIALREGLTVAAVEKQVARATLELLKWVDGW